MRLLLLTLLLVGCAKEKRFTEPVRLHDKITVDGDDLPDSGITLDPKLLTDGYETYTLYCASCHGEKGDGAGPAAAGMRPPPRNFVQGQFKFTGTGNGDLPADSALERTIRRGLDGTPMLPWDLSERELKAVIAYLKTLSPRWKEEGVKPELEVSPDPFKDGRAADAIALGRRVYHVAMGGAGCNGCHASFEPRDAVAQLYRDATGDELTVFNPGMYEMGLKESVYPVLRTAGRLRGACEVWLDEKPDPDSLQLQLNGTAIDRDEKHANGWDLLEPQAPDAGPFIRPGKPPAARLVFFGAACEQLKADPDASIVRSRNHKVLPPSFLFQKVKSSQQVGSAVNVGPYQRAPYSAAMQREDLYRIIGTGIGGAAMPGWKNVLDENKLWALTYYVQSLISKRGTPDATALRRGFDASLAKPTELQPDLKSDAGVR